MNEGEELKDEPEAELQALLAETLRQADYHWRRADAFERKATAVLAFSGALIVALFPITVQVVTSALGEAQHVALTTSAITGGLLVSAALAAINALRARRYKGVSTEEVARLTAAHMKRVGPGKGTTKGHQSLALRTFLEQFHQTGQQEGCNAEISPLQSLKKDADVRGTWFNWAVWLVFASLIFIVVTAATVIVGRM